MRRLDILKKMTAVILIFSCLLSFVPTAFAEDDTEEPAVCVTEGPEETEDPREENDPEAEPEETVPEETETTEPAGEVPEGAEPADGETGPEPEETFPGMPEDYRLSSSATVRKETLARYDASGTVAELEPGVDYVEDEIIFYAEDLGEAQLIAAAYGAELLSFSYHIGAARLSIGTVEDALEAAQDLTNNMPAVEADYLVTVDAADADDWFDYADSDPFLSDPDGDYQWQHDMVDSYEAWTVSTGSAAVKVGVIDTGADSQHADLAGKVTVIPLEDVSGYPDEDINGHGTHVTGIICASLGNGTGGAGIAPDIAVESYCALPGGTGRTAVIVAAIYRAISDESGHVPVDIINMSISNRYYSAVYDQALQDAYAAGVTVIAAMGNDGSNAVCYPAAYDHVIAVGAVDRTGKRARFSNFGSWCDIAAPGERIISTGISASSSSFEVDGEYYQYLSGTSQATPVVSGVAALYMSVAGHVSPGEMERVLKTTCTAFTVTNLGAGIVNAENLFASDTAAPVIGFISEAGEADPAALPYDACMVLSEAEGSGNGYRFIYTLDGSTPTGTNGTVYEGPVSLSGYAGKTVKIKAVCINIYNKKSAVAACSATVGLNPAVTGVTVSGTDSIVSGKAATYKAAVTTPETEKDPAQKVTWKLVSKAGCPGAAISTSGKLTTKSSDRGTVVIRATSVTDPSVYGEFTVTVRKAAPIETISLTYGSVTLVRTDGPAGMAQLQIRKLVNSKGVSVKPDIGSYNFRWTSSNKSVATVDANGVVTAVGKGTATIKCTVLDGSGKSASCKVRVKQPVEEIEIAGVATVAYGKSYKYKAVTSPSNANNRNVTWKLVSAPAGVKLTAKGRLKVPKSVRSGTVVIRALAADGSGVMAEKAVRIVKPASGIKLISPDGYAGAVVSSGTVSKLRLFTFDREGFLYSSSAVLEAAVSGNPDAELIWQSSDPGIAAVDAEGRVSAVSAGTAVITCRAADGSGVKTSAKVYVRVPVSSVTVRSSLPRMLYVTYMIAAGKSAKHTVYFGDTYGTPTNQSVSWSFSVTDADGRDVTDLVRSRGYVKLNSSGKLTLSKRMADYAGGRLLVTASAGDGSGSAGTIEYYISAPTAFLKCDSASMEVVSGRRYNLTVYTSEYTALKVSSSDPQVVSYMGYSGGGRRFIDGEWVYVYTVGVYSNKTGKAKLTVRTVDGTALETAVTVTSK